MKRIVVVMGHPNPASLCAALAQSYVEAARQAGHEVRVLDLSALQFDPVLRGGYKGVQPLEPDLVAAQEQIAWAEHLVVVYPIWWSAPPALLKGFFDRTFLPGFAFKYHANDPLWDRLLKGRSARLLVTSDSPAWYLFWVTRNPGVRMVKHGTLEFSGITPVRVSLFGGVRLSKAEQRAGWLQKVRELGLAGA